MIYSVSYSYFSSDEGWKMGGQSFIQVLFIYSRSQRESWQEVLRIVLRLVLFQSLDDVGALQYLDELKRWGQDKLLQNVFLSHPQADNIPFILGQLFTLQQLPILLKCALIFRKRILAESEEFHPNF